MPSPKLELEIKTLKATLRAAKQEIAELNRSLRLISQSDMIAREMWIKAHPDTLYTWPDRAKMIFWLLEENAKLKGGFDAGTTSGG